MSTMRLGECVTLERKGGTAIVSLNRPKKLNALSLDMFRGIRDAAKSLIENDTPGNKDVRCVILRGEGRAFCSGLDVKSFAKDPTKVQAAMAELLTREEGAAANLAQEVGYLWRKVPVPVVAVTQGYCFGGGLQIALGADLRYSSPDATFSIMEAKWGLIPDMSASVTLRELIGVDQAKELTFTGRIIPADEASRIGLVTRVSDDPMLEALKFAKEVETRSPDCIAAAKTMFNNSHSLSKLDCLAEEERLQRKLLLGWNQFSAVAKGMGLPDMIVPGFKDRDDCWEGELAADRNELQEKKN